MDGWKWERSETHPCIQETGYMTCRLEGEKMGSSINNNGTLATYTENKWITVSHHTGKTISDDLRNDMWKATLKSQDQKYL